jgi:hypothetical protein
MRRCKRRYGLLLGWLLGGLIGLLGCGQRPGEETTPASFAVERSYEEGPLKVQVRLDRQEIELSGLVTLELSAAIDPACEVEFPDVAQAAELFHVESVKTLPDRLEANRTVKTIRCELEPLEPGDCEIGPLTFAIRSKAASEEEKTELTTEAMVVKVTTSLGDEPGEPTIADIEDVVEVKPNRLWLWIGLGAGGLLAAGLVAGRALRPKKAEAVRRVYRPAHEIALETLRAIAAEKLVEQGRIKEFYERLSNCLRRYIEHRFRWRAPGQTTEEFLEHLKTSDTLAAEHKTELKKFLEHCDLVKFARYRPSPEQINESLTIAERFVEKTRSEEHRVEVTDGAPVAAGREP